MLHRTTAHRDRQRQQRREQQRRRRDRERRGVMVVAGVEVTAPVLDMLVRLHWLHEADTGNRTAVASAIARLLAASAEKNL